MSSLAFLGDDYRGPDDYQDTTPDVKVRIAKPSDNVGGSSFRPQTAHGLLMTAPGNDRRNVLYDEYGNDLTVLAPSQRGNYANTPTGVAVASNPTHSANDPVISPVNPNIVTGEATDTWYGIYRPNAGFPLPVGDVQYANQTNDMIGVDFNSPLNLPEHIDRQIQERTKNEPSRISRMPVVHQVTRPWDVVMGMWPWTGNKANISRPVAATPVFYEDPIANGAPYAGGNGAMAPNTPSLEPRELTYRVSPNPWDTNGDTYIDSGGYGP